MTFTIDTFKSTNYKISKVFYNTSPQDSFPYLLLNIDDCTFSKEYIVVKPETKCEYKDDFSEKELTKMSSNIAISSFEKLWESENDDYWNSYL